MVKTPRSRKAGKYGKKTVRKTPPAAKAGGVKKSKNSIKKQAPASMKKALVSKELMEALKENREKKKKTREENKTQDRRKKKRKISTSDKEPKEALKGKALKKARQALDNQDYELTVKVKKLWEKGREKGLPVDKKQEIISEIKRLIGGKVSSLIFKHDLARVFQLILREGKSEQNTFIIEELKPHVIELSKSKYGKFTVKCMLKHCSVAQRNIIFKSLTGHVKQLTLHAHAITVIDTFYNEYAKSSQRTEMVTEFYGKEFYIFRSSLSEHLSVVLQQYPEKRGALLAELLSLTQIFIEKGLTGYIIVQHLMLQCFLHCSPENIQELISEKLLDQIPNFVHTKEGSKIAQRCLWYGKVKQRKLIMRTFKGHVKDMACDPNGYLVLCALFDCIDDTVQVRKTVLSEIQTCLDRIVMSISGRKLLRYLIAGRESSQTHCQVIESLKVGEDNSVSKKDPETRRREILNAISPPVLSYCTENLESLLLDNSTGSLIPTVVEHASGDMTPLLKALIAHLTTETMESYPVHWALKKILNTEANLLRDLILDTVGPETISSWVNSNRGAWTVLRVLERGEVGASAKDALKLAGVASFTESKGRDALFEFLNR